MPTHLIDQYHLQDKVAEWARQEKGPDFITEEVNKLLPAGVTISKRSVQRYLAGPLKQVKTEIVKEDKRRVRKVMVQEFNTIGKAQALFSRLEHLAAALEDEIKERKEKNPNASLANAPGLDKLLTTFGHLRNMIETMAALQDRIAQYEVFMKFMSIVLETVRDLAPDAYEAVTQRIMSEWQLRQVLQGPRNEE